MNKLECVEKYLSYTCADMSSYTFSHNVSNITHQTQYMNQWEQKRDNFFCFFQYETKKNISKGKQKNLFFRKWNSILFFVPFKNETKKRFFPIHFGKNKKHYSISYWFIYYFIAEAAMVNWNDKLEIQEKSNNFNSHPIGM